MLGELAAAATPLRIQLAPLSREFTSARLLLESDTRSEKPAAGPRGAFIHFGSLKATTGRKRG
jgi:hypothetical protein